MDKKEVRRLILEKKEGRIKYFEGAFLPRCLYYFTSSFAFPDVAPFHKQWAKDLELMMSMYVEGFRECAKTSIIALMYDIRCICYRKKKFICAFSYDGRKATDYLFKIAIQLQTNARLIEDYGQLFYSDNIEKKSQKKSMSEFITENDIKLKAFSIGQSMRGEIFMSKDGIIRPDSLMFDDIDVYESVRNKAIIDKNFRFIEDEVLGGLADYAQIRILGNVIMEDGLNPRLKRKFQNNPKFKIHAQRIYDENGNITWNRFVRTDEEANRINSNIEDERKRVISLQTKILDLGEISFAQNFLGRAYKEGDRLIRDSYIRLISEDDNTDYDYVEMGIDCAFSEKSKSDEFSVTATGFKQVGDVLYKDVLENFSLIGEEKNNSNICTQVLNCYLRHEKKCRLIKVEGNNGGEIYAKMFKDSTVMKGYNLPVEVVTATKDKFTRLKVWEGAFQRGEIRFKIGKTQPLIDQLLDFTGEPGKKDDRVDSMVYSFLDAGAYFYFETI